MDATMHHWMTIFFFGNLAVWLFFLFLIYRNQTSNASSRSVEVCKKSNLNPYLTHILSHLVVLLKSGPSAGDIAVITEIIDHNRVRIPSNVV